MGSGLQLISSESGMCLGWEVLMPSPCNIDPLPMCVSADCPRKEQEGAPWVSEEYHEVCR